MRRTPLKRVSKRRAAELREYYRLKKEFLDRNWYCEFKACRKRAHEIHHRMGRGKYLNDSLTWFPICAEHHRWIHDNAKEARKLGYLLT